MTLAYSMLSFDVMVNQKAANGAHRDTIPAPAPSSVVPVGTLDSSSTEVTIGERIDTIGAELRRALTDLGPEAFLTLVYSEVREYAHTHDGSPLTWHRAAILVYAASHPAQARRVLFLCGMSDADIIRALDLETPLALT